MKLVMSLLLLISLSAQEVPNAVSKEYKSDKEKIEAEYQDAKGTLSEQNYSRYVVEIWGAIYIKNRPLRDRVLAYKGERIREEEFEDLKDEIRRNGKYRYELKASLYPLSADSVRLEIEADRSKRKKRRVSKYYNRRNWDDFDVDFDLDAESEAYGVSYDWSFLMIPISEDYSTGDLFQIGYRGEFEHNFYRGFLGLEYQTKFWNTVIRLGSGLTPTGVFQFNYSNGVDGSHWQSSIGNLNPNLRLTPQHIVGELYPSNSIGKLEILRDHHALRFYYGIENVESAFQDSLNIKDKKQVNGFRAEYSLSYLDDVQYPISGVYLNAKYQSLYMNSKTEDLPYQLGNSYATPLYKSGTYNRSYFGNIHALINYNRNAAIHLSAQAVYQRFNRSRFDYENPKTVGSIGFDQQELQMLTVAAGLRKRFDEDILELTYGMNQMRLYSAMEGEIKENFFEARYNNQTFEIKYSYIFDRSVENPLKHANFEGLIHHKTGMMFSIGFTFGSLY